MMCAYIANRPAQNHISTRTDDYFIGSHGVATPDSFWKVIIKSDNAIDWVIPNTPNAKRGMLDTYLLPISEVESLIGEPLDIPPELANQHHKHSWALPKGCDKS